MPESFDPYHKWLGISPKDQPPNHYRLLGIELFESDHDVIEAAADQRMAHIRTYQTGQSSALSQQILNELSAAKLCLLDSGKKSAYDERLSRQLALKAARAAPKEPAEEPSAEVVPLTELDAAASSIESGMQTVRPSAKSARRRKKSTWQAPVIVLAATILVSLPVVWFVLQANRDQTTAVKDAKVQSDGSSAQAKASASQQVAPTKPKQVTQSPGVQTPVQRSVDHQIAEEVLRRGGKLRLLVNGQSTEVNKPEGLPKSEFQVVDVEITHAQSDKVADLTFLAKAAHLESLSLWDSRITAASLGWLRGHATLKRLNVEDTRLPTGSLKQVLPLPQLEILLLAGCEVKASDLRDLADVKNLRVLGLQGARINDDDLRLLSQFPRLREVLLHAVPITDQGLVVLAESAPKLQTLVIATTKLSDDGLRHLTALKALKHLDIAHNSQLTGSGLHWLSQLPELEWLKLSATNITDDALEPVGKLAALKTLFLSNDRITDSGLKRLSSLTSLQHLELNETSVTPAGVAELQKTLPKCRIAFSPAPGTSPAADHKLAERSPKETSSGPLKVFEDEPEFVKALTAGNGAVRLVRDEAYSGKASAKVTPGQRFSEALPGLSVKIRKTPTASDEYRYLRFAWKKRGGQQIYFQLHYPGNWFNYCAGQPNFVSATKLADELPIEFVVVTRDLANDFGEFTLNGLALSAVDGDCAWFDHIYLARKLEDFERVTVPGNLHVGTPLAKADAGAPPRRTVDLLSKVDVAADRVNGDWKRENAALISPKQPAARVQLPYSPGGDYELTVVAERLSGNDSFVVGLVVDGRQVAMTLDGYGGETAGLADLDHHDGATNETTRRGRRLPPGESHTVVCTVRRGSVRVTCDGKEVFKWSGDASRLSNSVFWEVPDKQRLFLGAWDSEFKYTRVEIRPLSPAEVAGKASGGTTPPGQLADLVSEDLRQAVPEGEVLRKARLEFQKKFAPQLSGAAKSSALKRQLAEELIRKAGEIEKPDAQAYTLLQQAADLAESAGDVEVAWQAIDELSRSFTVELLPLRQESLIRVGKVAKSPEQSRDLADDACRLMARDLAAGRPDLVKKVAAQAQSFAKRSKDAVLVKAVAARAADALKLAGEYDGVAAARETLADTPDDPKANLAVGHYELCAGSKRELALAKLAKGDDPDWRKLAADDQAASRDRSTPKQQLTLADAWWSRAEKESWPGRHYLRMRSAEWYRLAMPALAGGERTRVVERLKDLLSADEGLPAWELFDLVRGEKFDTFVRIEPGGSLRTCVDYDGPMDISFVARTDSLNIRLFVHGHPSVIWNWEANPSELRVARPGGETIPVPVTPLDPNRWYSLRYRVTPRGTSVTVEGASVFGEDHAYSRFPRSAVGVNGEGPAVIDVKKVIVKPLPNS